MRLPSIMAVPCLVSTTNSGRGSITTKVAPLPRTAAHHFEAVFGWGDGFAESHLRFGEAARKAVAADDNDAMAHTSLAIYDLFSVTNGRCGSSAEEPMVCRLTAGGESQVRTRL